MADTYSNFYTEYYGSTVARFFTPPTVVVGWDTGEWLTTLFSKQDRGVTVIRNGVTFTEKRFASQVELAAADAYYLGGRTHEVSEEEGEYLEDAGYQVDITEVVP